MKNNSFKICVSGSAADNCPPGAFRKAKEVGYYIVKHGAVLVTGATIGIPEWATKGAKLGKGISIGFSPAATEHEHVHSYRLPTRNLDLIFYTGANYSGRNRMLVTFSDAVINICGRMGTLNEFTTAIEEYKTVGILVGSGGMSDEIKHLLSVAERSEKNLIFDSDPERLVIKVLQALKKTRAARKIKKPQGPPKISFSRSRSG